MTLNNEAEELNVVRIRRFDLAPIFTAFLSSCWLGLRKPKPEFFRRALCIAQADPATTLFIDDREQNLEPARALGVRTLKFTTPAQLGNVRVAVKSMELPPDRPPGRIIGEGDAAVPKLVKHLQTEAKVL